MYVPGNSDAWGDKESWGNGQSVDQSEHTHLLSLPYYTCVVVAPQNNGKSNIKDYRSS